MSNDVDPLIENQHHETRPRPDGDRPFHGFLSVQSRGVVALPPALRRRYGLDRPGAQIEILEREDGVLEVRPAVAVPADQAWFWTERWQAGEREVEAHVDADEVVQHSSEEAFIAYLASLGATAGDQPDRA